MPVGSHVIPRFYLEQFATPSNRKREYWRVWVYQKGKEPHHRVTSSQGVENGYFAFLHSDGTLDESLEGQLAKLENECSDVLVSAKSPLFDLRSTAHRNKLAYYASLLFSRATQRRNYSANNWRKVQEQFAEAIADDEYIADLAAFYGAKLNRPVIATEMRQILLALYKRQQEKSEAQNNYLQELLNHTDAMKSVLLEKPWQVWGTEDQGQFLTSDNPMISFIPMNNGELAPGFGLRTPGVVVAFPLAPTACLMMGTMGPDFVMARPAQIQKLNEALVRLCDRFVYSRKLSENVKEMVDQFGATAKYGETAFMPLNMTLPRLKEFMRQRLGLPPTEKLR